MIRTLHAKLSLTLLAVLLLAGTVISFAGFFSVRHFLDEVHQELHRELAAHLAEDSLPLDGGEVVPEALDQIFHMLMVINPSIEVYLLDAEGRILEFSAPAEVVVRDRVALEPIRRFLEPGSRLPIRGDDPRSVGGRKVFSATTLGPPERPEGFLYVVLAGQQWDSAVSMLQGSYILRLGIGVIVAGLFVALLVGLLAFRWITRRTRQLQRAMTRFEASDFRNYLPVADRSGRGGDEISRLARTFDAMAERLVAQLDELEKTDTLRRELVANISHDLRTPLTSLRGFLETLSLKGDRLSEDERRRYLEGAIRQADRLNRLVAGLFELARLDSGTQQLEIEPLTLAELAQDAVQQFRLEAERRGVQLEARVADAPALVEGDVGLLARVLDNLLDNGLRHTPEGGRVTVRLAELSNKVVLEVSDTGCGIDADDLPHVFDRLFQRQWRAESNGAGLGLAIARRIVELHGGTIRVESERGHGTTFSVELPAPGAGS